MPNLLIFVGGVLLWAATATASPVIPVKRLQAYGPGGPHHALQECATLFQERHGIEVAVEKAYPHNLRQKLFTDGDIYYGGAEYMLEEFHEENPDIIDVASQKMLNPRRIGVIVRKGNPHDIRQVEDLVQKEVNLLDVKLENMRHLHGAADGGSGRINHYAYTGQEGFNAWKKNKKIGAWVTYKTWHVKLDDDSEFIEIPGDHALRYTPIALTQRTQNREEAELFLSFLKSEEAQKIFLKHGWEPSLPD